MHPIASSPRRALVAALLTLVVAAGLLWPLPTSAQTEPVEPAGDVTADLVTVSQATLLGSLDVAEVEIGRARGSLRADPGGDGVQAHALANNLEASLLDSLELQQLLVQSEQSSPPDADAPAVDELVNVTDNSLLGASLARTRARALTGDATGCPAAGEPYTDADADLAGAEVLPETLSQNEALLALTGRGADDVVSSNATIERVDSSAVDGQAVRSQATADLAAVEVGGWQIGVVSQPRLAVTSPGPGTGFADAQAAMDAGALDWTAPVLQIRNPDGDVVTTLDAADGNTSFDIPGLATVSLGTVALTADGSDGTLAAEGELLRLEISQELDDVVDADVAVAPLTASATTPAGGVSCDEPQRVEGPTRVETGLEVSRQAFESATAAVLARSDEFPDALTASSLAAEVEGPILVNPPDALRDDVADELQRLGVEQVYLAGGTEALSAQVEQDVADLGVTTTRLDGNTRYHTAELIAREVADLGGPVGNAVLARDDVFADALSAGNLATWGRAPILLTQRDQLHGNAENALTDSGVVAQRDAFVAGGDQAVSQGVAADLRARGFTVERLAGGERYATAASIVERVIGGTEATLDPLYMATGRDFADALVAGPAAFHDGGALMLVDGRNYAASHATDDFLAARRDAVGRLFIVGGTAAINDSVVQQMQATLDGS